MSSLCFNSTSKDSTFFKQKTTLIQETWPEDIRFSFFMCKNRLSFPLMLFANTFTFNTCKNHPNINQGEACAVKEALTNNRTNKNRWEKARRVSDKQDKIYRSEVHTVLVPFCPFLLWNHFTIHCRKILFSATFAVIGVSSSNRSQSNWIKWNIHCRTCKGPVCRACSAPVNKHPGDRQEPRGLPWVSRFKEALRAVLKFLPPIIHEVSDY